MVYIELRLRMFLLQDSLGGNARTHMIACVHPGARYGLTYG